MRQVPDRRPPLGIIGNGRLARHVGHYLSLLGLPFVAWHRAMTDTPSTALAPASTVLVLISDGSIVPFIESWPALHDKTLVHCSGSLVTRVAHAAHPLMTFGPTLYDQAAYREIPFILDEGGPAFVDLLPGLPNPFFTVPSSERPRYHALCAMAGNFSTMLWQRFFEELEGFHIPASAAHPYLTRTAANLMTDPAAALTGPVARRDTRAIAANLRALEGDPFHAIYQAFAEAYDQRS